MDWLRKRQRLYWYDQYALNEQATAFAAYDPDRIAKELIDLGSDLVALYAGNQFGLAYYPSAIVPQHPGLAGRDYFGEVSSRLKAAGVRVIAYINWLNSAHPEWRVVPVGASEAEVRKSAPLTSWANPDLPEYRVQALPGGAWQVPCANSPRREQVVALAREICERYHPDAFHLDMFHCVEPCVCEFCRPSLAALLGTENPTWEELRAGWRTYIDWKAERQASLIAELTAVLHEYGVVAAHNASVPLTPELIGFGEGWLPHLDVFLSEAFEAFYSPCCDLNTSSLTVKLHHALGMPSWMLRTSHSAHYGHWPISKAQWELSASAVKANNGGAFGPCGIGAYPDTTTAKRLYDNVRHGFDFYMADDDLAEGAVSQAKVALLFSWATRKYSGPRGDYYWLEELTGWSRLLTEEHYPFDAVIAERLTSPDDLAQYSLVILPEPVNLSTACCEALRQWVEAGGTLIATGETSLEDEKGFWREDFGLAEVLGITWEGAIEGLFALERPLEPTPYKGAFQFVEATGRVIARRIETDPAGSVGGGEDPLPVGPAKWPAVTVSDFGQGKAYYVAFGLGRYFEQHGEEHTGELMSELVGAAFPTRQLEVEAPKTVEVTLFRQEAKGRFVVHLANRTVPWSLPTALRQPSEIIPVSDVVVRLPAPESLPKVEFRQVEGRWDIAGKWLEVRLDRLGAYAAIVVT